MRLITAMLVPLLIVGCAKDLAGMGLPTTQNRNIKDPKLTYLGVGGWLVRWRGETLLFAPSFSHPSFPPILVSANHRRIDKYMPLVSNVTVILIGHSHYDHLMDIPWVMLKYAPRAKAYGPKTSGHILAAVQVKPPLNFENVESKMAKVNCEDDKHCGVAQSGKWISSGPFRFMPIQSEHAPHFLGIDFLPGSYYRDLTTLPRTVWGWKEGTTLAWLLDLVDSTNRTVYRIHYQDSASNPPMGFPPVTINNRRVDVEILCAASWDQVNQYPMALLNLTKPKLLALGHWEDFFANDPYKPKVLRGQNEQLLIKNINSTNPKVKVVMPYPLTDVPLPWLTSPRNCCERD